MEPGHRYTHGALVQPKRWREGRSRQEAIIALSSPEPAAVEPSVRASEHLFAVDDVPPPFRFVLNVVHCRSAVFWPLRPLPDPAGSPSGRNRPGHDPAAAGAPDGLVFIAVGETVIVLTSPLRPY